ncbi:MAG: tRNA pseudouridine(55) synthase TruB [Legionella sp.]|nr:tRNA pseudouridine(55) synthase TruB [Legionella sp.]
MTKSKVLNGILLFNKPRGITSNTALQKVKRLFGATKAGHTGSLDPLATGMLPLCLGEATKVCHYLLHADKCYETTGLLGIKTNTGDAMGEAIAINNDFSITQTLLVQTLNQFKGHIKQIPSMFSALKHNGAPLYTYARKGIELHRDPRDIFISNLQLNDFNGQSFSLTVRCSKGTYIRNLVEDIGESLGVGAHVTALHRVYTAGFETMPMYTLDELIAMSEAQRLECLLPMDRAIDYLKPITLSDEEVLILRQGRIVTRLTNLETIECLRLYNENLDFIGLGEQQLSGEIKAKRLLSF